LISSIFVPYKVAVQTGPVPFPKHTSSPPTKIRHNTKLKSPPRFLRTITSHSDHDDFDHDDDYSDDYFND
jgi:hypothetical protein